MRVWIAVLVGVSLAAIGGAQERVVAGQQFTVTLDPAEGAAATEFTFNGKNWASGLGMAWEGFGVGSYYVPNRHLNESIKAAGKGLVYTYDCDGPNISGLHASRTLEPVADANALKVTWHIDHKGKEDQWVAPWVRHDVVPGGSFDKTDRVDVPSVNGIVSAQFSEYHLAARNWIAATDPTTKESVCAIYDADQTHAFLAQLGEKQPYQGLQTAFLPFLMKAGSAWETTYVITMVRGLTHVDFATEELAVQLDYSPGTLNVSIAGVKALPGVSLHASIMEANGKVTRLPEQRFDIAAGGLASITYNWAAPADGAYDFLALLKDGDRTIELGRTVRAPHGGIDAQFVVGKPRDVAFEPWTDGPYALQRKPVPLARDMAIANDTAVWIEPSLNKVFAEDVPQASGATNNAVRLSMARRESESFQVVVRPPENQIVSVQSVRVPTLQGDRGSIPAERISVYNVLHVPVPVPSYYEGPTGEWPDALLPFQPFDAIGGRNQPIWITVSAPEGIGAGMYRGTMEILTEELGAIPIQIEVEVFDFTLPETPALKTDFGLDLAASFELMKRFGYAGTESALRDAYLALGREGRVTLRETAQLPAESADYAAALRAFGDRLATLSADGVTTHGVPDSLIDLPEQLKLADAFVEERKLGDRAFTIIASDPKPAMWPRVFERIQMWRDTAPHIPVVVTTQGLEPFLSEAADIWAVHVPMFDTPNNRTVLDRIKNGGEVWWYVNHAPPRPYGNFFLDFDAIEHRILFWQAWVLGVKGFHYWSVNYAPPQDNPYKDLLDITPVNGDGLLLYPGPKGPVRSIRWETIRDGVEDYDYLVLFRTRMEALEKQGGNAALMDRVQKAYNLRDLVPSLVSYSRDAEVLQSKRAELGRLIGEMGALGGISGTGH